jgi:hypothetical protein
MFLGWYDPDKKTPARVKLAIACGRYSEKFGILAETCLTSIADAEELSTDSETAKFITVKGIYYIPRYTFFVGQEDPS